FGYPSQRNSDPFRTVVELVSKLIHCLKNQEAPKQQPEIVLVFRYENGIGGFFPVCAEEHLSGPGRPKVCKGFEPNLVRNPHGSRLEQTMMRGVTERTKHPGNTYESTKLHAALTSSPGRLTYTIEDEE